MPPTTVTTYEFSVPDWLSVVEHPNDAKRWPGDKPPRLTSPAKEAADRSRLLCAWSTHNGEDRPYGFSSVDGVYYVYPSGYDPEVKLGEFGTPDAVYFLFDGEPPNDLTGASEYDPPDGYLPPARIYRLQDGAHLLGFVIGRKLNLTAVGAPGDSIESLMVRMTVTMNVVDGLRLGRINRLLPYTRDTADIAIARLLHAESWQLKTSRMLPLFA